jgi:uncharacterized protein YjbI with pentapeptide repeats
MADAVLQGTCLEKADMSGAQLDAAELSGVDPKGQHAWRWISRCASLTGRSSAARLRCCLVRCAPHSSDVRGPYDIAW